MIVNYLSFNQLEFVVLLFRFSGITYYAEEKEYAITDNLTEETNERQLFRQFLLPIVEINVVEKASSENLNNIQVLPTPESPISSNLNNRSYVFFAISLLLRVNEAPKKTKKIRTCGVRLIVFQTMFRTSNAMNDYRFQGRTRARLNVQRCLVNDGKTGHRG